MRILFVTATSPRVREGSGTAVGIAVLREALEALGHEVGLVAPTPGGAASALGRLAFDWRARRAAREFRADAVVAFDLDGVFLPRSAALHVAAIKGVLADEKRFERGAARLSLSLLSWFERLHVRRADRVVTTSRYAAGVIEAFYGEPRERIRVVPELLDATRWKTALSRAPDRRGSPPAILCVAHLYPRKDIGTLVEAAARMRTPARVRIVGDGPERESLARACEQAGLGPRVVLRGHLSFEELAAEYRSADIFCLPSRQEGFGIVYLEAMAARLPIVAARVGATPEVVIDGETGLLVPPQDPDALARALDELTGNPTLRRRLGQAGERRVALYDAPHVARAFIEAIGLPRVSGAA